MAIFNFRRTRKGKPVQVKEKLYHIEVKTSTGGFVKIPVPVDTSLITLGQFQQYMEQEPIIQANTEEIEILELEIKLSGEGDPDAEVDVHSEADALAIQLAELNLLISEARLKQIQAIVPARYHSRLAHVSMSSYPVLMSVLQLDKSDIDPLIDFQYSPGVLPELEYYRELKNNSEKRREANITRPEVKARLKTLSKGRMVAVPVAEALFESRIATDVIRGKWHGVPDELQALIEEKGIKFEALRALIESGNADTPAQRREKLKRESLLNSYITRSDFQLWADAHRLLAHTLVPQNEEYSYSRAEARAESMKGLPLDVARAMVLFFLEARKLSTLHTLTYSAKASSPDATR